MERELFTHDNGGISFRVAWNANATPICVKAYANACVKDEDFNKCKGDPNYTYFKVGENRGYLFFSQPCFVIDNARAVYETEEGASVLIEGPNNDLYCIHCIIEKIELEVGENLTSYHGPVWGWDVCYPWVLTNKYVYIVAEQVKLPLYLWTSLCKDIYATGIDSQNPYNILYGPRGGVTLPEEEENVEQLQNEIEMFETAHAMQKAYRPFCNFLKSFHSKFTTVVKRPGCRWD